MLIVIAFVGFIVLSCVPLWVKIYKKACPVNYSAANWERNQDLATIPLKYDAWVSCYQVRPLDWELNDKGPRYVGKKANLAYYETIKFPTRDDFKRYCAFVEQEKQRKTLERENAYTQDFLESMKKVIKEEAAKAQQEMEQAKTIINTTPIVAEAKSENRIPLAQQYGLTIFGNDEGFIVKMADGSNNEYPYAAVQEVFLQLRRYPEDAEALLNRLGWNWKGARFNV